MRELEVIPGTVLLACQSKTDASLEKTGKTLTVTSAVASELTPGILTPVPKGNLVLVVQSLGLLSLHLLLMPLCFLQEKTLHMEQEILQ